MKIYKSEAEILADVRGNTLMIDDHITFECNITLPQISINCHNINCNNIDCCDINCYDINCHNIRCYDIDCCDIKCHNINCRDIKCHDIDYYAVCFAYKSFKCQSIIGRRENHKHFCLDSEIELLKAAGRKVRKNEQGNL